MEKTVSGFKKEGRGELFAVIFGGRGKEREISVLGGLSFIKRAAELGYRLLPIYIAPDGRFLYCEGDPLKIDAAGLDRLGTEAYPVRLSKRSGFLISGEVVSVKRAIIILHGDFGEDGSVQGALDTAGIDYLGAQTAASAFSLDKYIAKCVARELKIPTLDFAAYSAKNAEGENIENIKTKIERDIGYPVFIKPRALGSSVGASAANSPEELIAALKAAFAESPDIIAERCLSNKRELEAAYLSVGERTLVTPPGEVELFGKFYSYREKYSKESSARLHAKADIPEEISAKISEYTLKLASALGVRHFARFDYFLSENGLLFNEVNTIPGMTDKSLFFAMLEEEKIDFPAFLSLVFGDEP